MALTREASPRDVNQLNLKQGQFIAMGQHEALNMPKERGILAAALGVSLGSKLGL